MATETKNENSIQVLQPYWASGTWVFDDPDKGLKMEPFVGGSDDIISNLVDKVGLVHPELGFQLIFSTSEFPGFQLAADWTDTANGGNWYKVRGLGVDGWLCPALFKYFDEAPKTLYVAVKQLKTR